MAYIKINNKDFSMYCNKLEVSRHANYNAQTNAAGNTVADFINHKREITVGIIPLDDSAMVELQAELIKFNVSITFLDPVTKALNTINCIIPEDNIAYYTIQANKVMYNALELAFVEL
jgi:hypothetical protein